MSEDFFVMGAVLYVAIMLATWFETRLIGHKALLAGIFWPIALPMLALYQLSVQARPAVSRVLSVFARLGGK